MTTSQIKKLLAANSPMNAILTDLISENAANRVMMEAAYNEYKGDVPIKHRTFEYNSGQKIEQKIVNDYRGYIVDTSVGYLLGNPIKYQVDVKEYGDKTEVAEQVKEELSRFCLRNSIDDLDAETAKYASICGYGARLLYIKAQTGELRAMNIPSWECVFIKDASLDEPEFALRYYEMEDENGDDVQICEWYDLENVTIYELVGGVFQIKEEPRRHMFNSVPLIEFQNNSELQGDFEKVSELIDAYDIIVSDIQSESMEQRLAYMVFMGATIDSATLEAARQTGAFNMPSPEASVQYLTKQINDVFIENQKKTLKENIHKFSKTVDMSDELFSGAGQTGESRKWKLLSMENKAITKERKFTKALREQFRMIMYVWRAKGIAVLDDTIFWKFGRNLPLEITSESEILVKLKGVVSEKTRLGLASFIDDVDWEIEQMKEEALGEYAIPEETTPEEQIEEEEGEEDDPKPVEENM